MGGAPQGACLVMRGGSASKRGLASLLDVLPIEELLAGCKS